MRGEVVPGNRHRPPLVIGEGQPWGHSTPQHLPLSWLGRTDSDPGESPSQELQMLDPGPRMGGLGYPLILTQKLELLFHHLQSQGNATRLSPCCQRCDLTH